MSSVVGAQEPEKVGGKGGYVCASAWDGYHSVLDSSTYCTGYCTWFVWQKRPEAQLQNLGNAAEWYGRAKAKGVPVGSVPVVGAVATWGESAHAPEGHVAYVVGVNGPTITIEEMNRIAWDVSDTRTIPLASGEAPNGYIYGGPAGNGPGSASGAAPGGGAGAEPSGPGTGNTGGLAVLQENGTVVAKEGGLGSTWVTETGPNIKSIAVSGDRLAVLQENGTVAVKEGSLGAPWVTETGGVKAIAVSNNILAVLQENGTVVAKEGGLGSTWVTETGPNIKSIAVGE